MKKMGLEQILVCSTPSIFYLAGRWHEPGERLWALYLNTRGEVKLFANQLFKMNNADGVELIEYSDDDDPIAILAPHLLPGKIGVDNLWPSHFTLRLMSARADLTPVLGSQPVILARMIKDQEEKELLRRCSLLNDEALRRTIAEIHEGMTELELEECYTANAKAVADGVSFHPITCFGKNCAEPHHTNDSTRLKRGDCIVLDVGVSLNHYLSDITRTVYFGEIPEEQRRVHEICQRANEAGRAAIRPGVKMCEFDRAARQVIEDAGYGAYFIHRTGHGLGLEGHEYPDNSATSQVIAAPGMCFSVEPGIYLPGKYGVRVEDLILVTETGCETLNHLSRDFVTLG